MKFAQCLVAKMQTNSLKTIKECLDNIKAIEMNPANVVGGSAAFFSGRATVLTGKAQRKVDALQRQLEKLGDSSADD